jgi:hypothetical protein
MASTIAATVDRLVLTLWLQAEIRLHTTVRPHFVGKAPQSTQQSTQQSTPKNVLQSRPQRSSETLHKCTNRLLISSLIRRC